MNQTVVKLRLGKLGLNSEDENVLPKTERDIIGSQEGELSYQSEDDENVSKYSNCTEERNFSPG